MVSYTAWSGRLHTRCVQEAEVADAKKRKMFHVGLDHQKIAMMKTHGSLRAAEEALQSAAFMPNAQEEVEDRPPQRIAGVGAGTGQLCGPRKGCNSADYTTGLNAGLNRLDFLIKTLDRLDGQFRRSAHQRQFHKTFIGACLKKIVGQDLYRNLNTLLEQYDLDEIRTDVLLYTPRRMGKTMSVALFLAAYLWTQPSCEVSVYSPASRQSSKLLEAVAKMLVYLNGGTEQGLVVVRNDEVLEVRGTGQYASRLNSYPSNVSDFFLSSILLFGGPKKYDAHKAAAKVRC